MTYWTEKHQIRPKLGRSNTTRGAFYFNLIQISQVKVNDGSREDGSQSVKPKWTFGE